MNKNEFDDYLVRGWECGANIFYNGRIYFSQCEYISKEDYFHFYVYSFKAEKYIDYMFSSYRHKDGRHVDEIDHIDEIFKTRDAAKEFFLSSKIFEGKSFWEIGKDFEWLEEGGPSIIVD